MAAETSAARVADRGTSAPLDPAIEILLEQQAEIQAKLSLLLPQKYGANVRTELDHLRHKLRVLRTFADSHRFLDRTPVLSEMEEARSLQYQIECIETACLEHGHDLNDPRAVDTLESVHMHDAPSGFGDWMRRNYANCDVTVRAWKLRGNAVPESRDRHGQPQSVFFHSYKCPEENCMHYIYGFLHREDRDLHMRSHSAQAKRDSGLSLSSTPPPPLPPTSLSRSQPPPSFTNYPSPSHPLPGVGVLQLPPPPPASRSGEAKEHRGTLRSYSLISDYSSQHTPRDAVDTEVDPLLPPLKRSRVGPSRLESIGELRLLLGAGPCLRCKILKQQCDANDLCSSCHAAWEGPADPDFWRHLGCFRGALQSFVSTLVPAFLSPGRTDTPATSPLAQRHSITQYLERANLVGPEVAKVVQTNLDFDDDFWWAEDLAIMSSGDPTYVSMSQERAKRPPPILAALACSRGMGGTAYNFWQLLKLSGLLSVTRRAEAMAFPALHQAKLLLRELLLFDLQRPVPSILPEAADPEQQSADSDYERHSRYRAVCGCAVQFLQSFEGATAQGGVLNPRQWLSLFFALCIFSIARTILVDMVTLSLRRESGSSIHTQSGSPTNPAAMHAVYKALAATFIASSPVLLDDPATAMSYDDRELCNTASMIIKKNSWRGWNIPSTREFLLMLGNTELPGGVWHGFLRQQTPAMQAAPRLSELRRPSEEQSASQPLPAQMLTQVSGSMRPLPAADQWTMTPILPTTGIALVASPQSIGSDGNGGHEHAMSISSPLYPRSNGHGFTSPTPKIRPVYPRQHLGRVYCSRCSDYPEGFRGEHELRRHMDAKHAVMIKRWICVDPLDRLPTTSLRPAISLAKCKACLTLKRYGAYYNAAAHLRRAHFNPYKGTKINGEWPPMTVLKDWMEEVFQPLDEDQLSSDEEEYADYMVPPRRSRHSPPPEAPHHAAAPAPPAMVQGQPSLQPLLGPSMGGRKPVPNAAGGMHMPPMHVPPLQIPPLHGKPRQQQPLPPTLGSQAPHRRNTGPGILGEMLPSSAGHQQSQQTSPRQKTGSLSAPVVNSEEGHAPNRNRCPYPECGRVFKDLNAHMLTHMEERPEKCPIESCEYHTKGFARKYDKNRHALTHYKGTMVCPFCHGLYEKAFNRADVFKRHLTAVHNVEQTPPNSRKTALGTAASRHGTALVEGLDGRAPAKCSICHAQFMTAQEFYEHLDDCVLNVIVPVPRGTGAGTMLSVLAATGAPLVDKDSTPTKSQPKAERRDKAGEGAAEGTVKRETPLRHLLPGLPSDTDGEHERGRRPERRYEQAKEQAHGQEAGASRERRDGYFGGGLRSTLENGARR